MIVYRISTCRYIQDLSGRGASLYGGRWNSKDTYILYTAQSRALAMLETVVNIGEVPEVGYCLAEIDIPGESIHSFALAQMPEGWSTNPAPDHLKKIGDDFIAAGKYLALKMPSALMMEEYNYLINPAHPLFRKVKIASQREVNMDERLFPRATR